MQSHGRKKWFLSNDLQILYVNITAPKPNYCSSLMCDEGIFPHRPTSYTMSLSKDDIYTPKIQ